MDAHPLDSLLVSVIVCTRDCPASLQRALRSILASTYPAFEVTIVDQSERGPSSWLEEVAARESRVCYLHTRERGLSRAYNLGVQRSPGAIFAFTDDDCTVPPAWLASIVAAFASDAEADLLYGQVLAPPEPHGAGDVTPCLKISRPERLSVRDGFKVFGMGANFAVRRRLFARIGLFDEVLGGGGPLRSSQDYDFAYRAYRRGSTILLRPEVIVTHYGTRTKSQWPATLRAYGIGDGGFYLKHVRCRDFQALALLLQRLVSQSARQFAKRVLWRKESDLTYVRYILVGMWQSLHFSVDRETRLYLYPNRQHARSVTQDA
ncbi:MAG: glycosyltransferase [Chloroflexi bacterium]|nr:glycosyltransferase [Chloroflexota bacterium]